MARILRSYWADLNPVRGSEQAGLRPVVILSQDVFNQRSGTVIAAFRNGDRRSSYQPTPAGGISSYTRAQGLPKPAWVEISQIRTLSVERLGKKIGAVALDELEQIVEGLNEIIGAIAVGTPVTRRPPHRSRRAVCSHLM